MTGLIPDWVPAGLIFVLTCARIPLLYATPIAAGNLTPFLASLTPFLASGFATVSLTLYIPEVYVPVDQALGGGNVTDLILGVLMVSALWMIRESMESAADRIPFGSLRRTAIWAVTVCVMVSSFPFWEAPVSKRDLMAIYGSHTALLVYQAAACSYILWTCIMGTLGVKNSYRAMGKAFKISFRIVQLGFAFGLLSAGLRVPANFLADPTKNMVVGFYETVQQLALLSVAIGLTFPRIFTMARSLLLELRARYWLLRLIGPWHDLAKARPQLVFDKSSYSRIDAFRAGAVMRLVRRLTEMEDIVMEVEVSDDVRRLVDSAKQIFPPLTWEGGFDGASKT